MIGVLGDHADGRKVTVTMEVYTDGQRGWISAIGPKPSCGVSM